jgi:hypothetical protein
MDTNDYLLDRTEFGFRLLVIRNSADRAVESVGRILTSCPEGEEVRLGAEALLAIGAQLGSLMTSIRALAKKLDQRCPDVRPPLSVQLGQVEFDMGKTARETLEAAEATLRNAVTVLDEVNHHLVGEIDEELPVSGGPADVDIQAWLAGGVAEPQP